jgi:hypothetical protein
MKKLRCSSGTAMRVLAASALTMVAWLEHPDLTLLLLTPLLWQICKMLKKAKTKTTTMSEASRRPPNTFWCLIIKGEKYQLKLERLTILCSVQFCLEKLDCPVLQTGLSSFANRTVQFCAAEFLSIFSLPCNSGLEDMLYCVNFDVKVCNMFINLNYFLVNMLSLKNRMFQF